MHPHHHQRRPRSAIPVDGETPNAADLFSAFFQGWLVRQEHYLDELLTVKENIHRTRPDDLRDLVNRVLTHYQHYYEEKSRLAQSDIFLLFSPPWFSALERTFLWIAGFKPGLAFRVLGDSVHDLTDEQQRSIRRLKEETRMEERLLNDEMARIHESVGAPPVCGWGRKRGTAGEEETVTTADREIRSALELLVGNADTLRTNTVVRIGQILSPTQNVEFVTAGTRLQLTVRELGGMRKPGGRGVGEALN
ncbi:Protein ZW2 [Linum grandiflorum]